MQHLLSSIAVLLATASTVTWAQDDGDMSTSRIDLSLAYNKIVVAHLVFMILTFLVLIPAAILIARFGRTYFTWYPHHRNIQLGSLVFFIVAFFLGIGAAYPAPVGEQTHYQVGVTVFALIFVQAALGLAAHRLNAKKGKRYLGYIHAPLGLLIFGLAFWNMETGWNIWGSGYVAGAAPRDVLYAWMGLLVLLYLIGLTLLPKEIKRSREGHDNGLGEKGIKSDTNMVQTSRDLEDGARPAPAL